MSGWATEFLREDREEFEMPSWYNGTTKRFTGANDMKFEWVSRQLDDETVRVNTALSLSKAARATRLKEALRDEYYEQNTLADMGICEVCHLSEKECQCEDAADGI